jgi:ADP-ribose pyrophosphatase YjhB (NUDIX family)
MGADSDDELLNVYDAAGEIVGARPRTEAKQSGLAVGAINVIVRDAAGRVLLQRRPEGTENGGRWDKSVGGHVGAGEEFDVTAVRESGEELFDDPASARVVLSRSKAHFDHMIASSDLAAAVVLHRMGLKLNLRDVRIADGGGKRVVRYHVAMYEGRTAIPIEGFRPQPSEIESLSYFAVTEVDQMLLDGALAPNMAFLWLEYGHRLVGE